MLSTDAFKLRIARKLMWEISQWRFRLPKMTKYQIVRYNSQKVDQTKRLRNSILLKKEKFSWWTESRKYWLAILTTLTRSNWFESSWVRKKLRYKKMKGAQSSNTGLIKQGNKNDNSFDKYCLNWIIYYSDRWNCF